MNVEEDRKKETDPVYEDPIDIPLDNEEEEEEEENDVNVESNQDVNPAITSNTSTMTTTTEQIVSISNTAKFQTKLSKSVSNVNEDNESNQEPATKKIKIDNNAPSSSSSSTTTTATNYNNSNPTNNNSSPIENDKDKHQNKEKENPPKYDPSKSKKVPLHLLEKRRIGRIKAAEEFARRLKIIGIEKVESTTLPSSGGFQPLTVINQKNYSSDYIKKDDQIFAIRERKSLRNNNSSNDTDKSNTSYISEYTARNDEIDFSNPSSTIIIQPGSDSIKIGFALDNKPLIIPNCVAIPTTKFNEGHQRVQKTNRLQEAQPEEFYSLKDHLQSTFKQRMRYYKRKIQSNSYDQVSGFNAVTRGEPIPDQHDLGRISWIQTPHDDEIFIGENALRCTNENFIHRKPFCCSSTGTIFNITDENYSSIEEVYSDVTRILKYAIRELIARRKETKNNKANMDLLTSEQTKALDEDINEKTIFKGVLIIPDIYEKSHVENMIRLLLNEMSFSAVAIMQESLAACYGSGTGVSSCVVNVGATKTTVACVDDGAVVENSCVTLDYGGDDITRLFAKLLLMSNFPYEDWDMNNISGWRNAEALKKQCITFQDIDVTTQLFNFIRRIPNERTEKIDFKTFDEVMLAPLALFEPQIFTYLKQNGENVVLNKILRQQIPISRDLFTNLPNDLGSLTHENCQNHTTYADFQNDFNLIKNILDNVLENREVETSTTNHNKKLNMVPLDKAIIQSITNAALEVDIAKLSVFYSNILIIGGSSSIPAFDFMLTDRINIWRPRILSLNSFGTFYKHLLEKIKDLETTNKNHSTNTVPNQSSTANNTKNEGDEDGEEESMESADNESQKDTHSINDVSENSLKEQIDAMVRQELDQYLRKTETHTSGEHYLPVTVIPAPNDRDPSLILWKGAAVLAQIKLIEELYITSTDWDVHGSRILQHKCLFAY